MHYAPKTMFSELMNDDNLSLYDVIEMEEQHSRELAEDVILALASIIRENRENKRELKELREFKRKTEERSKEEYRNMQNTIANTLNKAIERTMEDRHK